MIDQLKGMDLFANPVYDIPEFLLIPEAFPPVLRPSDLVQPNEPDFTGMEDVRETILPRATVERAHLDVYDASGPCEIIPYRLTSRAWDIDSDQYHR